jgi:hypothetical protein
VHEQQQALGFLTTTRSAVTTCHADTIAGAMTKADIVNNKKNERTLLGALTGLTG